MKTKGNDDDRNWKEKLSDYFVNDGPKLILIVLWIGANLAVIFDTYNYYTVQSPSLYDFMGNGLTVARCAAASIKLNSALILVSVLRNFLSWLRGTFLGSYLPFDKNIIFHRYMAWTIAIMAFAHIMAHYINFYTLANATPQQLQLLNLNTNPTVQSLAYTSLAGVTGIFTTIIMVLMYTSAIKYIRSPMFNVFWYTHHLFILFFFCYCLFMVLQNSFYNLLPTGNGSLDHSFYTHLKEL